VDNFGSRAPRAVNALEEGFDDAGAVLTLPEQYRKRLRTTNGSERLNEEVHLPQRGIRGAPGQDEAWSTGRVYFDMRAYLEWKQGQPVSAVGDAAAAAVAAS
jgi:transposase-like protein